MRPDLRKPGRFLSSPAAGAAKHPAAFARLGFRRSEAPAAARSGGEAVAERRGSARHRLGVAKRPAAFARLGSCGEAEAELLRAPLPLPLGEGRGYRLLRAKASM